MVEVLEVSSQGLLGAIRQYWDIQPAPRLHRKNTVFETEVSNADALRFGIAFIVLAMAIVISWCVAGMVLL